MDMTTVFCMQVKALVVLAAREQCALGSVCLVLGPRSELLNRGSGECPKWEKRLRSGRLHEELEGLRIICVESGGRQEGS